jgi:hypothetical protein
MKWAAVPSVIALFLSNAVILESKPELLSLTLFGFMVGTILFGLAWVVIGEHAEHPSGAKRKRNSIAVELIRVGLVAGWIYVVFSIMMSHTPEDLRVTGLAAAYAIATAWWAMMLIGKDEHASHEYALPAMVASAITAISIALAKVPVEACIPISLGVLAARNVLQSRAG